MKITKLKPQATEAKKLRVAAYCRVSTDSEDQQDSLETQKAHYASWIQLHDDWENAGVFYDFGLSGTSTEAREGLHALLYECRIGRIDSILTKSISRFSRNTTDCLSLVRELLALGVSIYFEKENLDTGSMESELILSILSCMAEEESRSISENEKWAVQKRFADGTYQQSCLPYGYTRDAERKMVIVPEEAKVIQSIFQAVVSGVGTYTIARMLTEQNVPTRKGGKWSSTTVLGILSNERYVGDALFQKKFTDSSFRRHRNSGQVPNYRVLEHHDPIIDRDLFDRAQVVIQQRAKESGLQKGTDKYQRRYAFSGKIVCGVCGATWKRQTYSTGHSWVCSTHLTDIQSCSIKYIRDDVLKAAFVTMMNKLLFVRKQMLRPMYEGLRLASSDENLLRIRSLRGELEQNGARKDNLRKLRAQEIIDSVVFYQEMNRLDQQGDALRVEIAGLGKVDTGKMVLLKETEKLMRYVESAEPLSDFDNDLFASFVDGIVVYRRDCVGFRLKCGLTLKEELQCMGTK